MTHEQLRMQMLAGVITEGQYKAIINKEIEDAEKASLNESMIGGIVGIRAINQIPPREKTDYELAFEHFLGERYETKFENREQDPHTMNEADEAAAVGEKVEADAEDKLEATVDKLSDEQKAQLRAELAKAGITANSKIEDVAGKLDESLFEGEGDTKQKVASALSAIGGGLMRSMLVPLIPLIVGHTTGTGFGGGLAITAGVAGALIALAKLLGGEDSMEEGKEVEEPSLYEEEEDYGTNIVTGKKLPKPDPIVEEEVNEGKLDGLYMELKDVLFPYYTDLVGKERVSMIDDVIKELNSYILILQDEKKAKQ